AGLGEQVPGPVQVAFDGGQVRGGGPQRVEQVVAGFAVAEEDGVHQLLAVEGEPDRLAHVRVVEGLFLQVHDEGVVHPARPGDHFDAVVVGVPPGVGGGHAAGDVGLAGGDRGGAGRGVGHRGDLQCRVRGRLAPPVVAAVQHRGGVVAALPGERAGSGDGFADVPGALGDDEGEGGQGGADLGVGLAGGQLQCVVAVGGGGLQVEHGQPAVVLGALALD